MSSGSGRRERKKLETRERILDCAVTLFAARGYDATTLDDIGECADVARATVFNHFARKEDLVLGWFDRRRAELANTLAASAGGATDTAGRLSEGFEALAHIFEDDPHVGRAMVRAWLHAGGPLLTPDSETSRLLADIIRSGQQRGDIPRDIDADRAGLVVFDAYLGNLYRWVNDDQLTLEEQLLATLELILAGIAGRSHAR